MSECGLVVSNSTIDGKLAMRHARPGSPPQQSMRKLVGVTGHDRIGEQLVRQSTHTDGSADNPLSER
jgi:hypothetical protein